MDHAAPRTRRVAPVQRYLSLRWMANSSACSGVGVHSGSSCPAHAHEPAHLPPEHQLALRGHSASCVFADSNCSNVYTFSRGSDACARSVSLAQSYFCPSSESYAGEYQQKLSASSRRTTSSSKKLSTALGALLENVRASSAHRAPAMCPKCRYGESPERLCGFAGSLRDSYRRRRRVRK